ncbi:SapC family protein [Nitrincola sp. MINF-07-Sa-05]|uniref:SapC family protein n=1 Tax=Nitrincola salilacus TaxID=3400273 RepID=UPI0039186275
MAQMHIVTPDEFSNKSWKRVDNFAFASQRNLIPVVGSEVAKLASSLPLGFIKVADRFMMVAMTSMQPGINYFIMPDGNWLGDYVPVDLRCHPFKLLKPDNHPKKVLCIDQDCGLIAEAGEGESFFDEQGKPSPVMQSVIEFLSQVEQNREATQIAVNVLAEANLLKPWELTLNQGEEVHPVNGIYCVDEQALNNATDDVWLKLRKASATPLAYAQLISMNQLPKLQQAINLHTHWTQQKTN